MSVMFLMIGISLALAVGFLVAFIFSAHRGQFDDPVTPGMRILHDSEENKDNPEDPV